MNMSEGFIPESALAAVHAAPIDPADPADRAGPPDRSAAVVVGFVRERQVEFSFLHSLFMLYWYDGGNAGRVLPYISRSGVTGDLAAGRNGIVSDFLAQENADWLMWIDTDMGWEPNSVDRLLEAADPVERPVMGGLCFAQREDESDGVGGFRPVVWPVLMDWTFVDQQGGWQVRWDYPRNTVTRCHGIGSAFVLIHRSAFERVKARYVELSGNPNWAGWYTKVSNPTTGELVGEDLSFCARLMQLEIPVHVNTGVQTTHRKDVHLQEQDYWIQRAVAPAPEQVALIPREDWTAPRYAVIPTHNRPDRLAQLVAALGTQVDTIIVLDNASDPPVDWMQVAALAPPATVEVLRDMEQPPNLARFWNLLFDRCAKLAGDRGHDVWDVAVFNDDAVVPHGWFDVCSTLLRAHEKAVAAHTGTVPVHRRELLDAYPYPRDKRMCPWAFVVKGEAGLRADESMRWWFFDDDFCRQAIDAGGVLAVPGPLVINAEAVQSTTGVLAEQAQKDQVTFEAKWSAPDPLDLEPPTFTEVQVGTTPDGKPIVKPVLNKPVKVDPETGAVSW